MRLSIALHDSGIKKKPSKVPNDFSSLAPLMEKSFASFLAKNRHFSGVKAVSISLTLCGKVKIRKLNNEYRQKDYATDVLSFPVYENLRPDKKSHEKALPEIELGDIIICKEMAKKQAKEFEISLEQEIIHLTVHGFLHLLGFDHEVSRKEEIIMEKYEAELVRKIYKKMKDKK
jgi:probable rRNA maturation factor